MSWGAVEWTALGVVSSIVVTVLGFAIRATFKVADVQAEAEAAKKSASGAISRIITLEQQVTEFRVAVARDYVQSEMLVSLEKRIVDALDRMSGRIDDLIHRNQK